MKLFLETLLAYTIYEKVSLSFSYLTNYNLTYLYMSTYMKMYVLFFLCNTLGRILDLDLNYNILNILT